MFSDIFGDKRPYLYIENRTNLYISTVEDIIQLYEKIQDRVSGTEKKRFGFSIDVMQLYSQIGAESINELPKIPRHAIKNWHIHYRHQPPSIDDPIDWRKVVNYIMQSQPAIVLPEVFSDRGVQTTLEFIEGLP